MTAPNTTKLGIAVFDQTFGGIYLRKPTILCGRRKSGKFVVVTQFMVKTLLVGDRIVLFTAKNPEEVMRSVPSYTLDLSEAVDNGQLVICPYSAMQRDGTGPYATLPFPEALDELSKLVKDNGISYAIFDSVVPWTAIHPLEAMQDHVDTFFSTLDSLDLTSLLLLPEPASAAALSLSTTLREICPINLEISAKNFGAEFTLQVTKYQGVTGAAKKMPQKFALDLTPGVGFASPDAPKAKTMRDLEALEAYSRTAATNRQNAAQTFRPFLAGGAASFTGPGAAAPGAALPGQSKVESQKPKFGGGVGNAPGAAIPSFAAATSAAPPSFAPATSAAPPSFAAAQSATPPSFASAPSATPPSFASAPSVAPPSFAAAPSATPPSFAAAPSATPPSFAAASGASPPVRPKVESRKPAPDAATGAQDGFSFASVIDLPEFPPDDRRAAKSAARSGQPPEAQPRVSGIQFSSVIR